MRLLPSSWRDKVLSRRYAAVLASILFLASIPLLLAHSHRVAIQALPDTAPTRLPDGVVYQSTNYSCGPACLAGLFRYYGFFKSEREMAQLAGTSVALGTQLAGLVHAGEIQGFEPLVLNPSYEQLDLICHPAIIFQSRVYHLVTFWGLDQDGNLIIRDPVLGPTRWEPLEFRRNTPWHPTLLVYYPGRVPRCNPDSSPREILAHQRMLQAIGHSPGRLNGEWSNRMTEAVRGFQSEMNLPRTGEIDASTGYYLENAWKLVTRGSSGPFMSIDRSDEPIRRQAPILRLLTDGERVD